MTRSNQTLSDLNRRVSELPDPQPIFDLRVGFANDYDELFSGTFVKSVAASDVLEDALSAGRLLLSGPGGGAKTVILTRIAKMAGDRKIATVFVTLREWTSADNVNWRDLGSSTEKLTYLLRHFALGEVQPRALDALDSSISRVLILDGLNEVTSHIGQEIIDTLDEYARFSLNTAIIASDRLVRREFINPDRWTLCIVQPLSIAQVEAAVRADPEAQRLYENASPEERQLLTTPYFLNAFIHGQPLAVTRAGQMQNYFTRHALNDDAIDHAASAAFAVYANETRTFRLTSFQEHAGEAITKLLVDSGALVQDGDLAFFDHHLKHDYLASRYLVTDPSRWRSDVFNTVTFHGSSFETVVMAMEQVPDSISADQLLRRLYDWNIYGAGYSIAEGRASRVSADMQLVILAMFAERRWDLMKATAQRARDTLRLIDSSKARDFLAAASMADVFSLLRRVSDANEWFESWRQLFTKDLYSPAEDATVASLSDPDSVMGWTAANVLKRLACSEDQQSAIRGFVRQQDPTVRWRAVHVLGSLPSIQNLSALVDALGSADSVEVRFGAIRSLVEMAARGSTELAKQVFQNIATHFSAQNEHSSVLGEFERAIFIEESKAPKTWTRMVTEGIAALQRSASTSQDRERWDRVLTRLVANYGL